MGRLQKWYVSKPQLTVTDEFLSGNLICCYNGHVVSMVLKKDTCAIIRYFLVSTYDKNI